MQDTVKNYYYRGRIWELFNTFVESGWVRSVTSCGCSIPTLSVFKRKPFFKTTLRFRDPENRAAAHCLKWIPVLFLSYMWGLDLGHNAGQWHSFISCFPFNANLRAIFNIFFSLAVPYQNIQWNEYAIQEASPILSQDCQVLESVQIFAAKFVKGLLHVSYETALQRLRLYFLARRRIPGNLVCMYKVMHGLLEFPCDTDFAASTYIGLRGHTFKVHL